MDPFSDQGMHGTTGLSTGFLSGSVRAIGTREEKKKILEETSNDFLPRVERLNKKSTTIRPLTRNLKENIEYTVMMPDELYQKVAAGLDNSCGSFLYVATGLGASFSIISSYHVLPGYTSSQYINDYTTEQNDRRVDTRSC